MSTQPRLPSTLRTRTLPALCAGLAIVLSALSATAQTNREVRIGTFNTFLRSPGMYCLQSPENFLDCMANYVTVPAENASTIAPELLAEDLDILILNEVFDEVARQTLINELSPQYPHFVSKIDQEHIVVVIDVDDPEIESIKVNGEDSGLMVFSRFPFEPLTDPKYQWDPQYLEGTTQDVAFIVFDEYADPDSLAAKGVGLVRVQNPTDGEIYSIVFSHMQAGSKHAAIRQAQFDDAQRLIEATIAPPTEDHIFFGGDFNVRGEGGIVDWGVSYGGGTEWTDRFGQGFFFETLVDGWAATTSYEDAGITNFGALDNPDDDKRLDYLATSAGKLDSGWCVQHMRRREIGPSDHQLVRSDYNLGGPLCNPRNAWVYPPLDDYVNELGGYDMTEITHPASVQWFYYDLAPTGDPNELTTVSIGIPPEYLYDDATETGVLYEIYDPSDLSTPIPQYQKVETDLGVAIGDQFAGLNGMMHVVPNRFYLKFFSPAKPWSGDYTFVLHEHECTSAEDSCVIYPNENPSRVVGFDPNAFIGEDDSMWFRIDVAHAADSGGPQLVEIFAGSYQNPDNYEVELVDVVDTEEVLAHPKLQVDDPYYQEFGEQLEGTPSMYLVVRRVDATLGDKFEVGWSTNLTTAHSSNVAYGGTCTGAEFWRADLVCHDETNPEIGEDEIHLLMSADDGPWEEVAYFNFECNDGEVTKSIEQQLGERHFVDNLRFKLVEEDGPINPDDHGPILEIPTLAPDETVKPRQHHEWFFEGGHYALLLNLSRCPS